MWIRKSKFFGFCYADDISEKQFFAKNCKAEIIDEQILQMSFILMRGLDVDTIKNQINTFDFFEIEDAFVTQKFTQILNDFPSVKKIQLQINEASPVVVKQMKITMKGLKLQLV